MDVHLVHSVCSVYEAFWPVIFVAFRVFVAFMGHRGWTLEAFTELLVFRFVGLDVAGVGQHLWHLWGVGVVRLALGSRLAFICFFMLSMGGCLRVWCIGAQASPSYEPLLSELGIQLGGPFGLAWGLMVGGRGFASHGGVTLSRGWLCHRWKPLDIPRTHLHSATQLLIANISEILSSIELKLHSMFIWFILNTFH